MNTKRVFLCVLFRASPDCIVSWNADNKTDTCNQKLIWAILSIFHTVWGETSNRIFWQILFRTKYIFEFSSLLLHAPGACEYFCWNVKNTFFHIGCMGQGEGRWAGFVLTWWWLKYCRVFSFACIFLYRNEKLILVKIIQPFYSKHHAAERWDFEFGSNTTEKIGNSLKNLKTPWKV